MIKHTPGPWKLFVSSAGHFGVCTDPSPGDMATDICELHNVPDDEDMSNAQLIAAAPDLLDALEGLLNVSKQLDDFVSEGKKNKAWEAIAKAKGHT